MPKRVNISPHDLAYLKRAVSQRVTYAEMAKVIGVHVDTCKRILHKSGIVEFNAAKYISTTPLHQPQTWTRPCMTCGCQRPRPRMQYRCDRCHAAHRE